MFDFKKKKTEEERIKESTKIIEKYPDRIPIVVEKSKNSKVKDIDKNKYLVPSDMTLSQFLYIVRKRIDLDTSEALFFFINNTLCNNTMLLSEVYNKFKDKDGFLYIEYSTENTFG
jgi:GABA(A) receptor-associated protein|tara:strand:- start:24 stop:371 length:348 start_codon:yes stop_codon:yes gene_type:complete